MPDGSYTRGAFEPWSQTAYDAHDTVLETGNLWYAARQSGATPTPSAEAQRAAALAAAHANTPTVTQFDALGRPFAVTVDNKLNTPSPGTDAYYTTATEYDAAGSGRG